MGTTDVATYEKYMSAARNAHDKGDAEAAKRLVRAAQRLQKSQGADMSFMGRLKDNVVGVDDGVMSVGEKLATALNIGGESMTLGLVGDEAAAAADAAMGRGSYEDRLATRRGQERQLRQENPGVALGAEIAPAFIPGVGGGKIAAMAGSRLGRAGAGAALGFGAGATYGFMEGEGGAGERGTNAALTGALGGLFGGVAPRVIDGLASVPQGLRKVMQESRRRPTVPTLKAEKNLAYRAVDESGEVFTGDDIQGLYNRVTQRFDDGNYVEEVDTAGRAVLRTLEKRAEQPGTTLSQLDGIRQSLWKRYSAAPDQPFILDAISEIDELIDSKAGASELMGVARAANARYAKSQLLEDAFRKAEDQTASTGSGGNILNKYRQAVTSIINNPKKAKFFKPEEIDLMRNFVRGSRDENVARLVGKLSPDGNGLMMALQTGGLVATQGMSLPLMLAGSGAKGYADRAASRGVEQIQDVVSGFRPVPTRPELSGPAAGAIGAATPALEDRERLRGLLQ